MKERLGDRDGDCDCDCVDIDGAESCLNKGCWSVGTDLNRGRMLFLIAVPLDRWCSAESFPRIKVWL